MSETFLLYTPQGGAWIKDGHMEDIECRKAPLHPPHAYTLLLDGFDEAFLQEPWPVLSWHEKNSYAKNRTLTTHSALNVHFMRAHANILQSASTTFNADALNVSPHSFLKGVSLLAWHLGPAFEEPTLLYLTLPLQSRRLYLFKDGAPLFSRTLTSSDHALQDDIDATLYHVERSFQVPSNHIATISWDASDLLSFLQKQRRARLAFSHPLVKTCVRLRRKRITLVGACAANIVLASLTAYQGTDLFKKREAIQNLDLKLNSLSQTVKGVTNAAATSYAPLFAFERLKTAPHPLHDLKALASFNTKTMGIQALSWKKIQRNKAALEVQVCARTPLTHQAFEALVVTQQKSIPRSVPLALAEEATPVIHLEEALPPSHPCIALQSPHRGRP
ncbi:MAG: hypothetical protein ACK5TR_04440 [Alphaproteobacteria bacterium]|jgi:hypothetical protein|nr:hypothetical protein [Alphaproteobacteria bacterium]